MGLLEGKKGQDLGVAWFIGCRSSPGWYQAREDLEGFPFLV